MYIRLFLCVVVAGISFYYYIFKQNELTTLRIQIPTLAKELRNIQEENIRLKYEIDSFENPIHLMEMMKMPMVGTLQYVYADDVWVLPAEKKLEGKDFADFENLELP